MNRGATLGIRRTPTGVSERDARPWAPEPPWWASRQAAQARLLRFATALRVTRRQPRWEQLIWPKASFRPGTDRKREVA